MGVYIIGIIVFVIIAVICILLLKYFIKDEKRLKEVTTKELIQMGKNYTKEEIENKLFEQYINIITSIEYSNYVFLKDAVSDDVYNNFLLMAKEYQDKNETKVTEDIKKEFSKLIDFSTINDLEVIKLWIRYSDIEYTKGIRTIKDEKDNEIQAEVILSGNKDERLYHEYILTFVKNKTATENIVCPSCGYQTNMLTTSNCSRCEIEIVPKKMHWVYIDKVTTNISKQN